MTRFQHLANFAFACESRTGDAQSAFSRWLDRIAGAARGGAQRRRAACAPIYRITRIAKDRWVVERPGASMAHAFPDLERAVAFIRHECLDKAAAVELRIDDLYVTAQLDPNAPKSLFGESVL